MDRKLSETAEPKGIEVFCCYARKDQPLLLELKAHLAPLQREGLILLWDDMHIDAGTEWEKAIHHHLKTAHMILLLISPDFMASEYCYGIEMQQALERYERKEVVVIPIILRPVSWQRAPFSKLQVLPKDATPVTSSKWHHPDEAFLDITENIRRIAEKMLGKASDKGGVSSIISPIQLSSLGPAGLLPPVRSTLVLSQPDKKAPSLSAQPSQISPAVPSQPKQRYSRRKLFVGLGLAGLALVGGASLWWWETTPHLPYTYSGSTDGTVIWSPKTQRVASASLEHTLEIWDAFTGQNLKTYHGHTANIYGIAWSPDGQRVVTGGPDTIPRVWNVTTGESLSLEKHNNIIQDVAWSPNGQRIASASRDSTVQVYDAISGNLLYIYRGHSSVVVSVTWSPDNIHIASTGWDGYVNIWNATNGEAFFPPINTNAILNAVAWSPDGKYLAFGGDAQQVSIIDITGNTIYIYTGHTDVVRYIAWSPKSQRIASASFDRTAHVWDALSGNNVYIYRGHTTGLAHVTWSPDGKYIASGGINEDIQVWSPPS